MFGDAFSPYLIGALSDSFKPLIAAGPTLDPNMALKQPTILDRISYELTPEEYDVEFRALEYSLFSCCFFQALGAFFFFVVSFYVIGDKILAERQISCNADIIAQEPGHHSVHQSGSASGHSSDQS